MPSVTELLNHYGYIVLFVSLLLELIAFPLPGEALMTYCGVIVGQHKLSWMLSIIIATCGVMTGITISYLLGRIFGSTFFKRYGHYVHLGPDKMQKVALWFDKYGDKLLVFAYFIPGVRHITGYFSGISGVSYKKFAIYAYSGAFIWTATFISLGKVLGNNWEQYGNRITRYLIIFSFMAVLILTLIYIYRKYKEQLVRRLTISLQNALRIFHSAGKVKFIIAGSAVVFLTLSGLVIGGIQDLLANEFGQFDDTVNYLIQAIFTEQCTRFMNLMNTISSYPMLLFVTICTSLLVMKNNKNKGIDIRFVIIVMVGGELLQTVLRLIFRRIGPSGLLGIGEYTFPSKNTFMTVAVYGFLCYFIMCYIKKSWTRILTVSITIAVCLFSGLGVLYYQVQYPSDVYAGYIFGGVWLTLNVLLLEVYKILSEINSACDK